MLHRKGEITDKKKKRKLREEKFCYYLTRGNDGQKIKRPAVEPGSSAYRTGKKNVTKETIAEKQQGRKEKSQGYTLSEKNGKRRPGVKEDWGGGR